VGGKEIFVLLMLRMGAWR